MDIQSRASITSVEDLGLLIRAVRKSAKVRQDDLAALAGVSRQFAVDVERGKPTAQVGRILLLLHELGITLTAQIPQDAQQTLEKLRHQRETAPGGLRAAQARQAP